jgi:hypothetical protein
MKLKDVVQSLAYKERARKRPTDFTRKRKMGFTELVFFLLSLINESTQNALERFFPKISRSDVTMTQQSFSEARQKLKWEAIQELFDTMVNDIYTGLTERWHGYRVMAIDGSKIALPSDAHLREVFGTTGAGGTSATAQGSMLYDVYNDTIVDALLEPVSTDERTLAFRHIEKLEAMESFGKELVIFDRGYASLELIQRLMKAEITYLMRVRRKFNIQIDDAHEGISDVPLNESISVRVVKFKLPGGEQETLVTNLTDKRFGTKAYKELYFKRWPVETKYNEIKNKLEIENFSGRTETSIRQDFYATLCLSNLASVLRSEAQEHVDASRRNKNNKYKYHVNVNHEIGVLKDVFVTAVIVEDSKLRDKLFDYILERLKSRVVPIRPGRSVSRNKTPRQVKFHHNQKSNC